MAIPLVGAWVKEALERDIVFETKECGVPYILSVLLLSTFPWYLFLCHVVGLDFCLLCVIETYRFLHRKSVYLPLRPLKFVCALVRMEIMCRVWVAGHAYYLLTMRSNLLIFFWFLESIVVVVCT